MSRIFVIVCLLLAVFLPTDSGAQQTGKLSRIGYLAGGVAAARKPFLDAFREGMHDFGYVEGRDWILDARYAEGNFERLPSLAGDLIRLSPDVLFVSTANASLAAKAATSTIPIIFVAVADPLGVGLVASLARPGGNVTGITNIIAELGGKRLELLKEIVPTASRVAILVNPDVATVGIQIEHVKVAANALRLNLTPVLEVRKAGDLEGAFKAAVRYHADAGLRMVDPLVSALRKETAEFVLKYRLPVMHPFREDVESGGLVSYGTNLADQYRQAATFVQKILKGAKPADLPVEQPKKFELLVNLKTAKQIGLNIPPNVLARADKVIR